MTIKVGWWDLYLEGPAVPALIALAMVLLVVSLLVRRWSARGWLERCWAYLAGHWTERRTKRPRKETDAPGSS